MWSTKMPICNNHNLTKPQARAHDASFYTCIGASRLHLFKGIIEPGALVSCLFAIVGHTSLTLGFTMELVFRFSE
jgi:hypothetical protein